MKRSLLALRLFAGALLLVMGVVFTIPAAHAAPAHQPAAAPTCDTALLKQAHDLSGTLWVELTKIDGNFNHTYYAQTPELKKAITYTNEVYVQTTSCATIPFAWQMSRWSIAAYYNFYYYEMPNSPGDPILTIWTVTVNKQMGQLDNTMTLLLQSWKS